MITEQKQRDRIKETLLKERERETETETETERKNALRVSKGDVYLG